MSIWWPVCCWNNWIPNQFRRLRSHKRNCHGRNTVIEFLIKFTAPQTTTQTDRGWLVNFTYTHWTPKYLDSNSNRERGTLLVTTITIPMFDIIWQPVNSFLNYAVWLRGSKGRTKRRKGKCCGTLKCKRYSIYWASIFHKILYILYGAFYVDLSEAYDTVIQI